MHIGHIIKQVLDARPKGYTVTWFAQQLNCDRRNVYSIFKRTSIDTELLGRISRILDHNFFDDLSDSYNNEPPCLDTPLPPDSAAPEADSDIEPEADLDTDIALQK